MNAAFTAWLHEEEPGNDVGGGEWSSAWSACLEYARGATVAEIVEWLRGRDEFVGDAGHVTANAIEARFSPAPPEDAPC